MALETLALIIGTTGSTLSIIDYFARHQPVHVKEHLARSLKLMSEYMREKHQSKDPSNEWRNDWFSENQVSNPRVLRRLLDKTIKEIINDSEERKSEYIAKFWVNICQTSNSDIDEATAFSYFETIEALSWRQLCIIRLITLWKDQEVEINSIDNEEQIPQDQLASFYSIGRDYVKMMGDRYIIGPSVPTVNDNPFLSHPGSGWFPGSTKRLHSLMNLHEIPDGDIEKTFSLWNVKVIKSE